MSIKNAKYKIESAFLGSYIYMALCILVIIISSVVVFFLIRSRDAKMPEAVNLRMVSHNSQYAKIDMQMMTDGFASYEKEHFIFFKQDTGERFHFAFDEENIYIIKLYEGDEEKFKDIIEYTYSESEDDTPPKKELLLGASKRIPKDLMTIAVQEFRLGFNDEVSSDEEIRAEIGQYYLNIGEAPKRSVDDYLILLISIIILAFGGVIKYIVAASKSKKQMNLIEEQGKLQELYMQIDDRNAEEYEVERVILTKDYLVSLYPSISIIKYKDIAWVYVRKTLMRFAIETNRAIVIRTYDGKKHLIGKIATSKKYNEIFDESVKEIISRCPGSLVGFTKENKKEFKKIKEKIKA